MEEKCITRRDIVLRKCCTGIELDGWEERCEPLEEGFSFGVCCAWWLDRCGARGGCYHRTRLLALCSLRHPRMLGGARGCVWGGGGEGRGTEGVSLLLVIYCFSSRTSNLTQPCTLSTKPYRIANEYSDHKAALVSHCCCPFIQWWWWSVAAMLYQRQVPHRSPLRSMASKRVENRSKGPGTHTWRQSLPPGCASGRRYSGARSTRWSTKGSDACRRRA